MEFTLISQSGAEASRYTKFLDDEIVLKPNSRIQLNHAVLEKTEGAVFTEDQTLTLSIEEVDTLGGITEIGDTSISIVEGVYTYNQIRDSIKSQFTTLLTTGANADYFEAYKFALSPQLVGDVDIPLGGLISKPPQMETNAAIFATAGVSVGMDVNSEIVYQNASNNANVVSFYLHPESYFTQNQVYVEDEKTVSPKTLFTPSTTTSWKPITTESVLAESVAMGVSGRAYFGFYGQEYALDDTVGTNARTNGTSILNVISDRSFYTIPTMFASIAIEEYNGDVYGAFYVCRSTTFDTPRVWDTQRNNINFMVNLGRKTLTTTFDPKDPISVELGSYVDCSLPDWKTDPLLYIYGRIFTASREIIFDSRDYDEWFSKEFFNGLGYTTEPFRLSQKAFHPCFATNIKNWGVKISGAGLTTPNASIIKAYKLSATKELAKVIGIYKNTATSTSNYLYPNPVSLDGLIQPQTMLSFLFKDIFRLDSYVIRLNNLPIQSYKTNKNKNEKGYRQSILGVIPTPFSDNNTATEFDEDNQSYLSTTYNFSLPQIKNLKNQEMILNRFEIEVVRASDDKIATDIEMSSVNFTILDPIE